MSLQSDRQQSFRTYHGVAGEHSYDEDMLLAFAVAPESITTGHFNERFLGWLNGRLSAAHTSLPEAMQAYAVSKSVTNWSSLGTFTP